MGVKDHPHTHGVADPVLTRIVEQDKVPWYKKKNLRVLYLLLFPACMGGELTSGFDSQNLNAVQIVDAWQEYFDPSDSLLGFIGASYSLGSIISLPFIPLINDRFGRRWTILLASIVMCIGAIIQGCANGAAMYIVARVLLGFGIPPVVVAGSSLIGELSYPKERPIMTSLFNVTWFVGSILGAAITFGTMQLGTNWGWRIPCLLQMWPSAMQILFIFTIPESPRFLISKDRHEEAHKILAKYHAEGDMESEFVRAEMAQIQSTLEIELEFSKRSWWEMVRAPGMRRRTIIASFLGLFTQWSGNTLISYYLNELLEIIGITDANAKGHINIANTCWSLFNGVIISLLVRRFRRRVMYMTCAISLLCVYVGWTITMERVLATGNSAVANAVLFWIFAYSPCYNIGYNALTYTFLVELFPFAQRARGITIFQFFGKCAGFFTTYVNPIGLNRITWKWLLTYCCWLAFEIVFIYFLFPETGGRTLEELAFLFEGKDRADKVTMVVEKQIHHEDNMGVTTMEIDKEKGTTTKVETV
ncbi:general substrate transporter [Lineolata rhizophorae]|uniref:General substrate transporter n=1 Tax=Lineolata rhizophorae TaxID=578093 RepID=A0A6A6P5U6_9PEZI|nr:general substrate transporter [Lineolata rhizophorae]